MGRAKLSDDERTVTDPMIAQVVKDVVEAVDKLDIEGEGTGKGKPMERTHNGSLM